MAKKRLTRPEFAEDHRRSNPGLHLLYVKSAVRHLAMVDRMIAELGDEANGNTLEAAHALMIWREKQVETKAAYADAHEILRGCRRNIQRSKPEHDSDGEE